MQDKFLFFICWSLMKLITLQYIIRHVVLTILFSCLNICGTNAKIHKNAYIYTHTHTRNTRTQSVVQTHIYIYKSIHIYTHTTHAHAHAHTHTDHLQHKMSLAWRKLTLYLIYKDGQEGVRSWCLRLPETYVYIYTE